MLLHSGSIYPALMALEEDGLIRRKRGNGDSRSLIYELTRKGREVEVLHRMIVANVYFRTNEQRRGFSVPEQDRDLSDEKVVS